MPMPHHRPLVPLLLLLLALLGACSNLNCTRLEPLLGGDINLVRLGRVITDQLTEKSFPPLMPRNLEQPILTTTLVNINRLDQTSQFGRTLQSHVSSRFVELGYGVKELQLRKSLLLKEHQGEFMLSRDLSLIAEEHHAQAVVVGTYSVANRILYLSLRLVRPSDRSVLATYDERLCLDENTLQLLGLQYEELEELPAPKRSLLNRLLYW